MKKVVRCLLITLVGIVAAQGSEVTSEATINQDTTTQIVSKESPTYFYQLPFEDRMPYINLINSFIKEAGEPPQSSNCFIQKAVNEIPLESWKYFSSFYETVPSYIGDERNNELEYLAYFFVTK